MGEEKYTITVQLHCQLPSGLMIGYGEFPTLEAAVGKAYMEAQKRIDDCGNDTEYKEKTMYMTSMYYLEGGDGKAFDLVYQDEDGKKDILETYYFLMVNKLED